MPQKNDANAAQTQLGERIREIREYLGLSQSDVAAHLNLQRPAVGAIEAGKRRLTATELKQLAELFRYPVSYILGTDEEGPPAEVIALARATKNLTEKDRKELLRFAEFLKYQSGSAKQKGSR
jgi:transcriptional regulator with XRE-family HTH domain